MLTLEQIKKLSNKLWRLNNLYYITNKEGKQVGFQMTPEQLEYFEGMHTRNIILKARQLGFTTWLLIIHSPERKRLKSPIAKTHGSIIS